MSEVQILEKIHEDLKFLKREVSEIRLSIRLEPEIREEVIAQVEEARKRIAKGTFVKNEDILKEFDV